MMRRIHGKYYDFHPEGFILPGERDAFIRQVTNEMNITSSRTTESISRRPSSAVVKQKEQSQKNSDRPPTAFTPSSSSSKPLPYLWITKPVASSCGKGISVITGAQALANLSKRKRCIMQKYVHDPYLIDGKKFDLRICKLKDISS